MKKFRHRAEYAAYIIEDGVEYPLYYGTADEISKKLNITRGTLYSSVCRGTIIRQKYLIFRNN